MAIYDSMKLRKSKVVSPMYNAAFNEQIKTEKRKEHILYKGLKLYHLN